MTAEQPIADFCRLDRQRPLWPTTGHCW